MDLKLHANATTTPRTRAYIQKSQARNAALARELGIHSRTVARWKARRETVDRSTRPHRPQTNGMVERFNRRLGDHLDRMPQNRAAHHRRFLDHAERDAYLNTFVADYNRTRLRCLGYQAPAELLANLAAHNTKAGDEVVSQCYH